MSQMFNEVREEGSERECAQLVASPWLSPGALIDTACRVLFIMRTVTGEAHKRQMETRGRECPPVGDRRAKRQGWEVAGGERR